MIQILYVLFIIFVIVLLAGLAIYRFIQDKKYSKTFFNGSSEYLEL